MSKSLKQINVERKLYLFSLTVLKEQWVKNVSKSRIIVGNKVTLLHVETNFSDVYTLKPFIPFFLLLRTHCLNFASNWR